MKNKPRSIEFGEGNVSEKESKKHQLMKNREVKTIKNDERRFYRS
jgi:hypothetical protein